METAILKFLKFFLAGNRKLVAGLVIGVLVSVFGADTVSEWKDAACSVEASQEKEEIE